jgi:hypothetical protein
MVVSELFFWGVIMYNVLDSYHLFSRTHSLHFLLCHEGGGTVYLQNIGTHRTKHNSITPHKTTVSIFVTLCSSFGINVEDVTFLI